MMLNGVTQAAADSAVVQMVAALGNAAVGTAGRAEVL